MKTRIIVGANYAYACISSQGRYLDVRLEHGRSQQSMRESAQEMRTRANELLARAQLIEVASEQL